MKRTSFLFLITSFVMFANHPLLAYDATVNGLYYNLSGGNAELTCLSYNSSTNQYSSNYKGDITIPQTITYNGKSYIVTSIKDHAFYRCDQLTSVYIPKSITKIGDNAFTGCTKNKKVTFEDGTSSLTIGKKQNKNEQVYYGLFQDCTLVTLHLGRTLSYSTHAFRINTSAGSGYGGPFEGKTTLTSLTIGNNVSSIGDGLFYGCKGLTSISLPNSVQEVGNGAFRNCTSLQIFNMGDNVTKVGEYAFQDCSSLISASISQKVIEIGAHAFDNCSKLANATIPESVETIGDYAFYNCSKLTNIVLSNSVTTIGLCVFSGCTGLTDITLSDNLTTIGGGAFGNCTGLTSLEIPNSVSTIGNSTFTGCSNLKEIKIKDGTTALSLGVGKPYQYGNVATYYYGLFSDCPLTTLYLGRDITYESQTYNNITKGCSTPFENQSSLVNLTIGNDVTKLSKYLFYGCTSLTSATISSNITLVETDAFYGCTGIKEIKIEDGTTAISFGKMQDCPLETIYIGRDLVNSDAFMNQEKVKEITIGESVAAISNEALNGVKSEKAVINCNIPDVLTQTDGWFYGASFKEVVIGDNVVKIGKYAFYNQLNMTTISFGNKVSKIASYALAGCSNLSTMYCYSVTPPICSSTTFKEDTKLFCDLYVPKASLSLYQEADQWKEFRSIAINPNDASGIDATQINNGIENDFYKLDGIRLPSAPTKRSMYIHQKSKYMIR